MAAGRIADRTTMPGYTRNIPTTGSDVGRYAGGTWGTTGAGFNRTAAERYQGVPAYGGPVGGTEGIGGGPGAPAQNRGLGDVIGETNRAQARRSLENEGLRIGDMSRSYQAETERRADLAQQARGLENESMVASARELSATNQRRSALAQQARESEIASAAKLGDWSKQVKSVVEAGAGWTTVELNDGTVERRAGLRSVRNNNPGNIEYGDFAKKHGAIGTDGRFAVFSSVDDGFKAQTSLLGNYAKKGATISSMVSRYAPAFENNPTAYAAAIAGEIGVPVGTKMSDLSPKQMNDLARAMHKVEGVGQIKTTQVEAPRKGYTEVAGYYGQATPAATQVAANTAGPAAGGVESRAQNAATTARQAAIDSAVEQGHPRDSPTVQAAADLAAKEAYDAVMAGTTVVAAEPTTAKPATATTAGTTAPTARPATVDRVTTRAVPASLAVQKPTATQPYQRSLPGQIAAAGIDMLTGTNPVTLGANLVSLLATGSTIGGAVWDASHGKYGPNQYSPGDTAENREGATGRGREYTTPTRTTPEQAADVLEESTVPTTPAETFIAKYIDPPAPTEIPRASIPEPVYDWEPRAAFAARQILLGGLNATL